MEKTYSLTSVNIDKISEEIAMFLKNRKQLPENVIRARLSAETALLHWLENGCENCEAVQKPQYFQIRDFRIANGIFGLQFTVYFLEGIFVIFLPHFSDILRPTKKKGGKDDEKDFE